MVNLQRCYIILPYLDLPVIVESEVKKFVFKKVSKVSVDVGSTVWAVRGTEITVSCRASSNFDTPKILWYRNGVVMTDRFRGSVAAIDGILRIRRLTRFNEDTYTCKASNTAGERRALFTAKLFGMWKVSYFGITCSDHNCTEDESLVSFLHEGRDQNNWK